MHGPDGQHIPRHPESFGVCSLTYGRSQRMGHMKDTPGQEVVKLPLLHLCGNEMENASRNKHTYVTHGNGCHRAGVDSRQML